MKTKNKIAAVVVSGIALLLAGCGGGGSGSSASSGSGSSVALAALTNSNAQTASAVSTNSANMAVGGGQLGGGALAAAGVTNTKGGNLNLSALARAIVTAVQGNAGQLTAGGLVGGVIQKTVPCDVGSVAVTWDDADNSGTLTSGDSFSMNFNSCTFYSVNATISGGLAMTNMVFTGNPGVTTAWSAKADFTFNNASVQEGSVSGQLNGDMGFDLSTTDSITDTGSISGSSLTVVQNGRTTTLSNYAIDFTQNANSGAYTLAINGGVYDTKLGGKIDVKTTTTFSGINLAAGAPDTGSLTMTGANNTSVVLTAQGGGNVQLQIDSNGDGQVDSVVNTTYNQLSSL